MAANVTTGPSGAEGKAASDAGRLLADAVHEWARARFGDADTAHIATGAIHRSIDNLRKDADIVARSTDVTSRETLGALVDSRQQVLYTAAAAKLINASDEMLRRLLDVHA